MVPIFSPCTDSPYKISRFTSFLKLLLSPEVKYKERLLPVGEKSLVFDSSWLVDNDHEVVQPLPVILVDDVSQKVGPSLIST